MNIWNDLLDEVKKNLPDEIECELKLMHSKSALTRFANSQIHQNVDEESAEIYLTIHKDSKTTTISPTIAKTWRASKLLPPDVPLPPPAGCESTSGCGACRSGRQTDVFAVPPMR